MNELNLKLYKTNYRFYFFYFRFYFKDFTLLSKGYSKVNYFNLMNVFMDHDIFNKLRFK